jgi:hypothetical protein
VTPRARRGDPSTSWDAAASVEELTIRETHRALLDLLEAEEGTHEALWARFQRDRLWREWPDSSVSGFRTRCRELVDAGLVEDSGRKERLGSGRWAIVWRVTALGRAAA